MGRKHVIKLDLFKGLSADMSGDLTSREIDVSEMDKASIHGTWVAGPVGEFRVQVKHYSDISLEDSWSTLDSGSAWTIDGTNDEIQIVLTETPFVKLRLQWVRTSGSGTLVSYLSAKSVGA